MADHALTLVIDAQDRASGILRGIGGVLSSVVVGALADAARASEDTDAAIRGLAVTVNNAGGSWDQDGQAIEAAIAQYEHLSGVSNSQLRPALANLINETGSVDDGLDRMSTALDLAAGAHIPLEQASRMLGRVSEENLNVFRRLGLDLNEVVKPGMSAAAKEAAVLAAVSDRYGGAAAAAKKPTDDWKNALSDLQNNVGGLLGPLGTIVSLAPGISLTFSAISGGITTLLPMLAALDIELVPVLIALAALAALVGVVAVAGNLVQGRGALDFAGFGGGGGTGDTGSLGLPNGAMTNSGAPIYDNYGNQVGTYAEGGVVPGPIGMPQRAIVHGGEEVIPVGGRSSRNGGGGDLHIHVDGPIYSMGDFEQQVATAVLNVKQRGGFRGVLA